MRHASLFSGIGGPEVAAAMLGWENVFHCEINPFGRAVLEYWFPESVSYEDIKQTSFKEWRGRVDVLTGGFPCQPFSYAGKRGGRDDDRYLWPEMLRAIDEIRPTWVIGENVAGITTMVEGGVCADLGCDSSLFAEGDDLHRYELDRTFTIERICRDLEHLGYSVQPMLVPAAAVGAPHRRDRVFIVAFDADPDRGDDAGRPGCVPHECGTQPLQERDEIRESGVATDIRSALQRLAEDSFGVRRDGGRREEEPGLRGQRKPCTRDTERIRREARTHPSNSAFGGEGTSEAGASLEGGGCHGDVQQGEREREAQRPDGSSQLLWTSSDTKRRGSDEVHEHLQPGIADGDEPLRVGCFRTTPDSVREGLEREDESGDCEAGERMCVRGDLTGYDRSSLLPGARWADFPTVSPIHRGNDGIPIRLDNLSIPFSKWRTESLKAYGNAIVPQVMYRIFQAIEFAEANSKTDINF